MWVKVPEIKYDFWCERDISGTNGTKREKYGEKYSGVNAANALKNNIQRLISHRVFKLNLF